jgi:hypothetical protein
MRSHALTTIAAATSLAFTLAACQGTTVSSTQSDSARTSVAPSAQTSSYIVQAKSLAAAKAAVKRVGGMITHELGIIDAVGARLSPAQAETLRAHGSTVFVDSMIEPTSTTTGSSSGSALDTWYPTLVNADQLHAQGITGTGITIAIVDSGMQHDPTIVKGTANQTRLLAGFDAIGNALIGKVTSTDTDNYGHGTHLGSIMVSTRLGPSGGYNGVAPDASLVYVKAFDDLGRGSYANVIRGIDWVVANKTKYKIRVMNLSFSAAPQSWYWNDPLNQAVMKAWQAGIVVVAAAGNSGPRAMTVGVPGNVPYVVTVGAMTDNFTRDNATDDRLASFSSAGPTYEGFVKPDLVAPGGHMLGLMGFSDYLSKTYPLFYDSTYYFQMSGTSQAAAVTSAIAALLLQAQPTLTPDEVKCKLMSGARPALDATSKLAYSLFQQGAGLVDAYAATYSSASTCANQGLNISFDLKGTKHYAGPAREDAAGGYYYVVDSKGDPISGQGYTWNNGYTWNQGYIWNNGYLWNQGYLWNNGYLWNSGYLWSNGYLWNQSTVAPTSAFAGVNTWVNPE